MALPARAASGGGSFTVRLRGDNAPVMAARVLQLVKAHWYDGNDWHRVEPDFVTQGGAPGANEYHGHPRFMRDELGIVPHARGTIGMSTGEHDTGERQDEAGERDQQAEREGQDHRQCARIHQGCGDDRERALIAHEQKVGNGALGLQTHAAQQRVRGVADEVAALREREGIADDGPQHPDEAQRDEAHGGRVR